MIKKSILIILFLFFTFINLMANEIKFIDMTKERKKVKIDFEQIKEDKKMENRFYERIKDSIKQIKIKEIIDSFDFICENCSLSKKVPKSLIDGQINPYDKNIIAILYQNLLYPEIGNNFEIHLFYVNTKIKEVVWIGNLRFDSLFTNKSVTMQTMLLRWNKNGKDISVVKRKYGKDNEEILLTFDTKNKRQKIFKNKELNCRTSIIEVNTFLNKKMRDKILENTKLRELLEVYKNFFYHQESKKVIFVRVDKNKAGFNIVKRLIYDVEKDKYYEIVKDKDYEKDIVYKRFDMQHFQLFSVSSDGLSLLGETETIRGDTYLVVLNLEPKE